ncbi:drug resistance transporter EmrB/QacA subfamily [Brachyspira sp. CAG:484]|nr:drug resistance transporter EmrB/QacA subfamily [Brachyspira sp. CAG:484]
MEEIIQKKTNPYIVALAVLLPSFLALAASSATNVSQPHIAGFYGATQYEANTVITCYIISGGLMLPVTGYLVRTIGKKLLMYYSIWIFCIGCLLCLLAPNFQALIAARVVQGIGSGCILPLCQTILLEVFPEEQRGVAMGLFGVAAMFSPLAGPFLGGYLTDNYSWQWIFIMNIPMCMLSFLLVKLFVPSDKPEKQKYNKKFDIVGYSSIVVAMACMQIVLDKGQQWNWFDTTWICWLTGICIFSFVLFYVWELEYKYPVIDIRVFKDRNFMFGTLASSFINVMLYSTLLLVPMFVQSLLGYSPSMSGLTMFPRAIICLIGLIVVGEISRFVEARLLATIGLLIMAVSVLMLTQMNTASSMESVILPNILLCIGVPTAFVPITALSFQTLPASKNADAAALHALFKNIVTAIATSASATFIARVSQVHQNYLVGNLTPHNPMFQYKLMALKSKFLIHYPSVMAAKKANGMLYKELLQQAKLASFFDAFTVLAMMCIIIIPVLYILKSKKKVSN